MMASARDHVDRCTQARYHACFDPTNGAARTMRDLMRLVASGGCETASLTGPCVDMAPVGRDVVLSTLKAEGRPFAELDSSLVVADDRGMPSLCYVPRVPNHAEPPPPYAAAFLELLQGLLSAQRPDVVLTYGGGAIHRAVIAAAKTSGARVLFRIMNFRYARKDLFDAVDGVLVPAAYVGAEYKRMLGIESVSIPCPLDWSRTVATSRDARFLTYVAPNMEKGLPWAARILDELSEKRPDIPILVVEGRGKLVELARRVSEKARHHIWASPTVTDPRSFLSCTRVLLMPSYVEPSGRLAQEAVLNDIPVVASTRGGLAETVRPWLQAIERLWDDDAAYATEVKRCTIAKQPWTEDALRGQYIEHLAGFSRDDTRPGTSAVPLVTRALERAADLRREGAEAAVRREPGPAPQLSPSRLADLVK